MKESPTPYSDPRINQLRKYIGALSAFRDIQMVLQSVIEKLPPPVIYRMLINGCIVTYCRSFTQGAYGSLKDEYDHFDNPIHQKFHNEVWDSRNWVCAHFDPESSTALYGGNPDITDNYRISFQKDIGATFYMEEPFITPRNLKIFRDVCEIQRMRIEQDISKLMKAQFVLDMPEPPDYDKFYILGKDIVPLPKFLNMPSPGPSGESPS